MTRRVPMRNGKRFFSKLARFSTGVARGLVGPLAGPVAGPLANMAIQGWDITSASINAAKISKEFAPTIKRAILAMHQSHTKMQRMVRSHLRR